MDIEGEREKGKKRKKRKKKRERKKKKERKKLTTPVCGSFAPLLKVDASVLEQDSS